MVTTHAWLWYSFSPKCWKLQHSFTVVKVWASGLERAYSSTFFPISNHRRFPALFLKELIMGKGISSGGRSLQKPLRWRWHRQWTWHRHQLHVAASLKTLFKSCACQYHEKNILCSFVTPVLNYRKQATRHVPEISNKQIKLVFSWSVLPNCILDEVQKLVCGLNKIGNILLWAFFLLLLWNTLGLCLCAWKLLWNVCGVFFLLLFYNVLSNWGLFVTTELSEVTSVVF